MEKFDIQEKQGFDVIYVRKRNIEIQVVPTETIPENIPNEALIAFATFSKDAHGKPLEGNKSLVMAFCIINPDAIQYEVYLFDSLVHTAIDVYFQSVFAFKYDKIDFSEGYRAKYIDSRPTDPSKINPDLLAYIMRSNPDDGLDYYEWKEQRLN